MNRPKVILKSLAPSKKTLALWPRADPPRNPWIGFWILVNFFRLIEESFCRWKETWTRGREKLALWREAFLPQKGKRQIRAGGVPCRYVVLEASQVRFAPLDVKSGGLRFFRSLEARSKNFRSFSVALGRLNNFSARLRPSKNEIS